MNTHILPSLIIETTPKGSTYYILYWDHGDGVIFYNYLILKDAELPFTVSELINMILKNAASAIVCVGVGAVIGDLDEDFRRVIVKGD